MLLTSAEISSWVGSFFWPFIRIGAMLMVMPVIGTQLVPTRIRLILAVLITFVVMHGLPAMPVVDIISADGVLISAQQFLIGISMGFVLQVVFGALMVGGQLVAMSMGLGFASMTDPLNGVSVPSVGQLYVMASTLVFLSMEGHLAAIQVLAESFSFIPVGLEGLATNALMTLVNWAGIIFVGAALIALPTVASIMLVNLAFGIMMKTAPQFNIFNVLFPVTMTFGFFVMILTMPNVVPTFSDLVSSVFDLYHRMGMS